MSRSSKPKFPLEDDQRSTGPRRLSLPSSRSLVIDLLYFQRNMPTVSHSRNMNLSKVAETRSLSEQRIAWCLLFMKAYAQIAQGLPELRRTYMSWPWPHIYEHPSSVANLAVKRDYGGEEWLFFAPIYSPHDVPLTTLQKRLNDYRFNPVEQVFKTQQKLARLPLVIRRVLWWLRLHVSGRKRIKRLGTFGLTTLAGEGATILNPRAPLTTILTYGPLEPDGTCEVTIAYDHRVMDGRIVARALELLEVVLTGDILQELKTIASIATNTDKSAA